MARRSSQGWSSFAGIALMLWLAAWLVSGCAEVRVLDATPSPSTPVPVTGPQPSVSGDHDLAVIAVEFDPPLDFGRLSLGQPLTLLVAVENTGRMAERSVIVEARLSGPDDPALLVTQQATIASIAAGEIQVVRIPRLKEIPQRKVYHLEVMAAPVTGEIDLSDNRRAFDIQIQPER